MSELHTACKAAAAESYHRTIEWLGLEGTPRIIKFQPLCHRQGYQPPGLLLDQVAQGPSNLVLNTSRDGASTTSLGSPYQHLTTLLVILPNREKLGAPAASCTAGSLCGGSMVVKGTAIVWYQDGDKGGQAFQPQSTLVSRSVVTGKSCYFCWSLFGSLQRSQPSIP